MDTSSADRKKSKDNGGPSGCPTGQTDCGGLCVDLRSNESHCGSCDSACASGEKCAGTGQCAGGCSTDLVDCSSKCVDTDTDASNCGACANACAPGEKCDGAGQCALDCQGGNAGQACDSGHVCSGGQCLNGGWAPSGLIWDGTDDLIVMTESSQLVAIKL